jgi:hypothetical protein
VARVLRACAWRPLQQCQSTMQAGGGVRRAEGVQRAPLRGVKGRRERGRVRPRRGGAASRVERWRSTAMLLRVLRRPSLGPIWFLVGLCRQRAVRFSLLFARRRVVEANVPVGHRPDSEHARHERRGRLAQAGISTALVLQHGANAAREPRRACAKTVDDAREGRVEHFEHESAAAVVGRAPVDDSEQARATVC